jgi:adenosine/AMP kinase
LKINLNVLRGAKKLSVEVENKKKKRKKMEKTFFIKTGEDLTELLRKVTEEIKNLVKGVLGELAEIEQQGNLATHVAKIMETTMGWFSGMKTWVFRSGLNLSRELE